MHYNNNCTKSEINNILKLANVDTCTETTSQAQTAAEHFQGCLAGHCPRGARVVPRGAHCESVTVRVSKAGHFHFDHMPELETEV